ncbi:MAG TPA: peptidoglycan-associated lipoprotein Pal [Vicinamibacterales bacterium]|jgi:peptidoglycan-associated lipoprotein|nr:peptidoglycan-associated lipoprotein Pal [Vicinamibacterales bacterium]
MKHWVRVLATAAIVASVGVGACAKKKPAPPPAPAPAPAPPPTTPPAPPPPPAPPAPAPAPQPTEDEIFARKSLEEINAEKPLTDAYFDLDSSQIRGDATGALQKDAEWMKRWPSTKVTIEGHCDSRGSSEYNLALGDRRAKAVQDYLVSLGISADRIQTVSKGKEQPVCSEQNEACWQQNRRGHFVVTAK